MSAREVLDSRLASGDITIEEYQRLLAALSPSTSPPVSNSGPPPLPAGKVAPPPLPPVNPAYAAVGGQQRQAQPAGSKTPVFVWIIAAVAVFAAIAFMGVRAISGGLTVAQIVHDGRLINFSIANTSARGDDVLFYVVQNGIEQCQYVTRINGNTKHDIKFPCSQLADGKFELFAVWADTQPGLAAAAERF